MTHCPQDDTLPAEGGEHLEPGKGTAGDNGIAIRYDLWLREWQGALSHGCHRIAQNLSSRCPRAQLRRRRGKRMLERLVSPVSDSGLPAVSLISIAQALLVAQHLSFRQAARVLGARQSAVSRRIRS